MQYDHAELLPCLLELLHAAEWLKASLASICTATTGYTTQPSSQHLSGAALALAIAQMTVPPDSLLLLKRTYRDHDALHTSFIQRIRIFRLACCPQPRWVCEVYSFTLIVYLWVVHPGSALLTNQTTPLNPKIQILACKITLQPGRILATTIRSEYYSIV